MPELHHPFPPREIRIFDQSMVNAAPAWGELEGILPGVVAADNVTNPKWAVGGMHWNPAFASGNVDCMEAAMATAQMARWGDFSIFRAENDPDIPGALSQVERLEFSGTRHAPPDIALPPGCQVV